MHTPERPPGEPLPGPDSPPAAPVPPERVEAYLRLAELVLGEPLPEWQRRVVAAALAGGPVAPRRGRRYLP